MVKKKELYCSNCGEKIHTLHGLIPKKCEECGTEFEWKHIENLTDLLHLLTLAASTFIPMVIMILITKLFIEITLLINIGLLAILVIWFNVAENVLVNLGLNLYKNIEYK